MNKVLIIAEWHEKNIKSATLSAITAGLQLAESVDVCIAAPNPELFLEQLIHKKGIGRILLVTSQVFAAPLAEYYSELLVPLAKQYRYLITAATTFGKNILPRVAAKLDVGQISDVVEICDECTYVRPIYAGNALVKVKNHASIQCLTVRATSFSPATEGEQTATVDNISFQPSIVNKSQWIKLEQAKSERPELTAAKIVVSGGRGLQNAENFKMLEQFADSLGAAVGASRAAVDAGFVPNDYQVGQTGKIVAPQLYFAIGISGAIQHIAGMKESKVIVAINKDAEAPIFQIADYGLVGDLFEIVPVLEKALKEKMQCT
jgi:electron transfer flavoprotein alpha subunit